MVNIKKVAHQIKFDGMYNTVYIEVQEELNDENPTVEKIEELLLSKEYYIWEYKELNRYGELTSVHAKKLDIKEDEEESSKVFKQKLNDEVQQLRNLEMFEVNSKNSAYSIWIGSVGVMVIFMAHNIIALFSELYTTHSTLVYTMYAAIMGLTYWAYKKAKQNHENQHAKYTVLLDDARKMVKDGLNNKYFSYNEFYEPIPTQAV
jgi:cbb3-type cytochrome oxidase subunit 3